MVNMQVFLYKKQINRLKTLFITFEKNSSLSVSLICNAADSCHDKLNILNILDNIFENLHDTEYIPFAATPKAYEIIVLSDTCTIHQDNSFGIIGIEYFSKSFMSFLSIYFIFTFFKIFINY